MVESRPPARANGFSLVEMMVALVFTLVLMAGMASVFKASLSTFYTSGEILSSARRNRMSIDQLSEDLNAACMYMANGFSGPVNPSANNPTFYILPNMPITGAPSPAAAGQPTTADQLFFCMDQPLPFPAFLGSPPPPSVGTEIMNGTVPGAAANTYQINCTNATYAQQVVTAFNYGANQVPALQNPSIVFKDSTETGYISSVSATGSVVTVVTGPSPFVGITGIGSQAISSNPHNQGAGMVFVQASQMVRYSVQYLQLDPTSAVGVPCLVRDQGTYNVNGFVAEQAQQIITENIMGFKVYLSVNSGQTWAGLDLSAATSGFSGWTNGIMATDASSLTNQLAAEVAVGWPALTLAGNNDWFRSIPTLVRVDVTTRTASQRTEYSTVANTAAYKQLTQSLVFVPRHSGMPSN